MRRLIRPCAALAAASLFAGCFYVIPPVLVVENNLGGGGGGAPLLINDNSEARVLELERSSDTIQPITIQVIDPEGDPVAIRVEYRVGSGDTAFDPASLVRVVDEDDVTLQQGVFTETDPLPTSAEGRVYVIDWDWQRDLGTPQAEISVRISIVGDISLGGGVAFTSDNLTIGNDQAVVSDVVITGGRGTVAVRFALSDSTGDSNDVAPFFRVRQPNGSPGPRRAFTAIDPAVLAGLTPPTGGAPLQVTFAWDTASEPPLATSTGDIVTVELVPTDLDGLEGTAGISQSFTITNNDPPTVLAVSGSRAADAQAGAPIAVTLADPEGDPTDVTGTFTTADGLFTDEPMTFVENTSALAAAAGGTAHVLTWDYDADIGDGNQPHQVFISIAPSAPGGASATSPPFGVGNAPPLLDASGTSLPGIQSGSVVFSFTLLDTLRDPASLTAQLSTDGGQSFQTASTLVSPTTGLLTADPDDPAAGFAHLFVWDSVGDLPAADGQAIRFRLVADDGLPGGAGTPTDLDFTLSNVVTGGGPALTLRDVSPSSGSAAGGTLVTLVGTGFAQGDVTVTFGAAPATDVLVVSSRLLTATAPPGALGATVSVTVTSAGSGAFATLPSAFAYKPEVTFRALQSATPNEADQALPVEIVLRLGPADTLAAPLTVLVSDAGSGSASPDVDYASFGTVSTTFPMGAGSGAIASVPVTVIQDLIAEGDETVDLELQGAADLALGPVTAHRVRITDDETRVTSFDPDPERAQVKGSTTLRYTVSGPANTVLTLEEAPFDGSATTTIFGTSQVVTPFPSFPFGEAPSAPYRLTANLPGVFAEDAQAAFASPFLFDIDESDADQVLAVAAFSDGTYAVGGTFAQATRFGAPGDPGAVTIDNGHFFNTGYVARFRADGTLLWVRSAEVGVDTFTSVTALAATPDGGLFVTGVFPGAQTLDFAGRSVASDPATFAQGFIALLDADGNARWLRRDGDGDGSPGVVVVPERVAALPDGGCAVFAEYEGGGITLGTDDLVTVPLAFRGSQDIYVARYAADGSLLWARDAGGDRSEIVGGVDAFPDGSVVISGTMARNTSSGVVTFGFDKTGTEVVFPRNTTRGNEAFIARYDSAGRLCWVRSGGTSRADVGLCVAALPSGTAALGGGIGDGAAPLVATFGSISLTTAGLRDGFVVIYGPDGDELAGTRFGGPSLDDVTHLARLPDQSLLAMGGFRIAGPIVFGDGEPNETTLVGTGNNDEFLLRLLPELITVGGEAHMRPKLAYARFAAFSPGQDEFQLAATPHGGALFAAQGFDEVTIGVGEGGETFLDIPSFSDGDPNRTLPYVARYEPVNYRITEVLPEGHAWTALASGGSALGVDVAATSDGGAFAIGRFRSSTTLGLGGASGGSSVPVTGLDPYRFLARYDGDGSVRFVEVAEDISVVSAAFDGGAVVGGTFGGSTAPSLFGPPAAPIASLPGDPDHTGFTDRHLLVARYDESGGLLWARQATGDGRDFLRSVAAASDGGAFAMGDVEVELLFDDPATDPDIELVVDEAAFVARYDATGSTLWATTIEGIVGALGGMGATPAGGTVTVGPGSGTVVLGHAAGGPTSTLESVFFPSLVLARYDRDGAPLQVRQLTTGSSPQNGVADLAVAPDGRFVLAFEMSSEVTLGSTDPGDQEVVLAFDGFLMDAAGAIAAFDADGSLRWAVRIDATHPTPDGTNEVQTSAASVALLPDGSVLVTGTMEGDTTFASFDPAGPRVTLSSTPGAGGEPTEDAYLARFDRDGRLLYAVRNQGVRNEDGVSVAALSDGTALWLTNRDPSFDADVTVGPGEANEETVPLNGTRYLLHKTFPYREAK